MTTTKRTFEDLDPPITIRYAVDGCVTKSKEEWNKIGIHLIDQETSDSTWNITFMSECRQTWNEVVNNVPEFSQPHEAFRILQYLCSDRIVDYLNELRVLSNATGNATGNAKHFWNYWLLFETHHVLYNNGFNMKDIGNIVSTHFEKFTINNAKEYYEHSPAYYDLQQSYNPYPTYETASLCDLMILQCVYELIERKYPVAVRYPHAVNVPYHAQFLSSIPTGLLLAGSAPQYMMTNQCIPEPSDLDFFVYGKTFEERRETVQSFLKYLYNMSPNLRLIMYSSVIIVILPGAKHTIQIIYQDCSTIEGVLSRFDISAARCGFFNYGWMICLSAFLAHKSKIIINSDTKVHPYRLRKWNAKGYTIISSVKFEDAQDPKEYRYFSIPHSDPNPLYSNHLLKCLYHVDTVVYTYHEAINAFRYKSLNSGIYEVPVRAVKTSDDIDSIVNAMELYMSHQFSKTFEIETGVMNVQYIDHSNTMHVYGIPNAMVKWFAKFDRCLTHKFSAYYTTIRSVSLKKLFIQAKDAKFHDVHGNMIPDFLRINKQQPFSCTMRIYPDHTTAVSNGILVWKCDMVRSVEFMSLNSIPIISALTECDV
jgi:hypothetical protein